MERGVEEADINECMMDLSPLSSQNECKEGKMSYSSILHQMLEQQKRKPGRRCKKKTLMKMAKLLAIAHGWDSETTAMPKARYSDTHEVCATQKGSHLKSIPSNSAPSVIITKTNPVQDKGDDGCKETLHSTSSVDVACASQAATQINKLNKTFKTKKILSVSKKLMKEESTLNRAAEENSTTTPQLQEDPVLEQDTPVLPRPLSAYKIQKKSTKGGSIISKEEIKNKDLPGPTQDLPKTSSEKKKTNKESRQGNSNNNMKEKSFAKIAEDCNDTASSKAKTVSSLGQVFTQKAQEDIRDCNKGGANTIETVCTKDTETSRRDTSGYKGTEELLKPKRKAGRPFKKRTLIRMAKLLAIAQEVESKNYFNIKQCNVNEGDVLSSQQQVLPCLPPTSSKVGKRKRDSKITESNVITHPVRRSTRTQGHTVNYKAMVENKDRKQEHVTADKLVHAAKSVKEVANPEGTPMVSLITYHVKLIGKKQRFAKGGKVRKATSMENASWMADNLMKHENELTISLTESPGENIKEKGTNKCKTIKNTLSDSVEVIKEAAHKLPNPAETSENMPKDGMVKGKKKHKRLKQKMLVAKLGSKITDVISEPNDNITSLKSSSQNRPDKKIKNKNITVDERLTGAATTNEKMSTVKMSTNKNSLNMSLNDNLLANQKRKNSGKRTVKEKSTCLESNVPYTKHDPIAFISDLSNSSLEKKLNINMKETAKNKGKCKAVKEKVILTTPDVENKQTKYSVNSRTFGQTLKEKASIRFSKLLPGEYLKAKIDTDVHLKEKCHSKSEVTCQRGKTKASCFATNTKKPHGAFKVAKTEDAASGYNSDLACSSPVQGNPSCPMDLNVVKQKRGKSATSEQCFVKASETSLETFASPPYDTTEEIKQVDSITSAVTIRKPHTARKKRRRNKTGWDTVKKSKRPRSNEPCRKVSHSSTNNSEHAINLRLGHSQLDEELINIKLKDDICNFNGSQSSEALCIQSNVNALQGNNPINQDHAKKMAVNTKLKYTTKLKNGRLNELKCYSQTHSGNKPFFCARCDQSFSSLKSLRLPQVSKVCSEKRDEGDKSKVDVEGFLVAQNAEGQINTPMYFRCQLCKQLLRHWCQYTLHLQTHIKNQHSICEICGQHYDHVPEISIHCRACCKSSGEERACHSSLSNIWTEPKPVQDHTVEPYLSSLPSDNPKVFLDGHENVHSHKNMPYSSPSETTERAIIDIQSPSPRVLNTDGQSMSNYSPTNTDCEHAVLASHSVINSGSDLRHPQPPRFAFRSLTHCHCGRYSCGQCGNPFKQRNKLWLHRSLHRQKGNSFSCTQCNLQFHFLGSYMDHMQEHAAKTPYACPICPNSFDTAKNLNTHFSNYHKPRDCLKCSTCGKNFSNMINLKKHKMLHKGISSYLHPHPVFPVKAP